MEKEIKRVCELMAGDMKRIVDARVSEFAELGRKDEKAIFSEMCFCILTANYSAEGGIRIQKALGNGFVTLPEAALTSRLRELGHRYPNVRAKYIVEARRHLGSLKRIVSSSDAASLREWLVTNVKGLGYKEASHFLRNVGFTNVAILDFHIIDILERCGAVVRPKTFTRNKYIEIEKVLKKLASRIGVNLAELDLYLWYLETGKVLKY